MELRKLLLRALLWSLGFVAVTGVLAVTFGTGRVMERVLVTCFLTALACALMLPIASLIDREKARSSGVLGMVAVVVEFFLALALTWDLPRTYFAVSADEEIVVSMFLFGAGAILAMGFLRMIHNPRATLAGQTGLWLTCVLFIILEFATWIPRTWRSYQNDLADTAACIAIFGGLCVASMVNAVNSDNKAWRLVSIVSAALAGAMWLIRIWFGSSSDLGMVTFCLLTSLSAVIAHSNVMRLCVLTNEQRWLRWATVGFAIVTASLIDLEVIGSLYGIIPYGNRVIGRTAGSAGITAACGTLALIVLSRMNRRVAFETIPHEILEMKIVCPSCAKKHTVPLGESRCPGCGLRFDIKVEEPRCPNCDYLLYKLTSNRCPECGTNIK